MILVTNDDGIDSPGLKTLVEALETIAPVSVAAPHAERSAISHALTLHRPLRAEPIRERWWSVDGTPADCVLLAVKHLLEQRPRLVVSGINCGVNLGDDVIYSGTVAGAVEGLLHGIQSIAVSLEGRIGFDFGPAVKFSVALAKNILDDPLPEDIMLNVNIPRAAPKNGLKWEVTRLGKRIYKTDVEVREDPRGVTYYWIGGQEPDRIEEPDTDLDCVARGIISVTPLKLDFTAYSVIEELETRKAAITALTSANPPRSEDAGRKSK